MPEKSVPTRKHSGTRMPALPRDPQVIAAAMLLAPESLRGLEEPFLSRYGPRWRSMIIIACAACLLLVACCLLVARHFLVAIYD